MIVAATDAAPLVTPDAELACGALWATYRDFRQDHPDMEGQIESVKGLVENRLGGDNKPVYAPSGATSVTEGKESFDQWYRDIEGINLNYQEPLVLSEVSPGTFVYEDNEFFPLDGRGYPDERDGHNFHFTTEVHGTFVYRGGEQFTFAGDDDVFVFVNRNLAIDLGGVHGVEMANIDFDSQAAALGIEIGGTYSLHIFHAERHTSESNFRIETTIDCVQ